jgi:uncharacterized protein YqhQ
MVYQQMSERIPSYGGQALIEGVMMRGSRAVAAAMRDPNGTIIITTESLNKIYSSRLKDIPFLRGLILLWDSLVLGMRFLSLSANTQATEKEEKIEGPTLYLTVAASMLIGIGIFFLAPTALVEWISKALGLSTIISLLFEAIIRLGFVIGYIWLIGKMHEIQRVFAYHGAEHKTINAYEKHAELTPQNVAQYSLEHPRCGTGFLLTLVIIAILLFAPFKPLPLLPRLLVQFTLIPVLSGLAYEYIRWTSNNLKSPLVRFLIKPNLALQRLTTREPDLKMLEVSISAFNAMMEKELIENSKRLVP